MQVWRKRTRIKTVRLSDLGINTYFSRIFRVRKQYLDILGLGEFATEEEIKKAWKKMALQFHPDKNPSENAQEEFIKICDAYEKLSVSSFEKVEDNLPKSSNEFYKKYHKNLTPEELEKRLQKAREYAKYKEVYEENILSLSFLSLKKSFLYKFSNVVAIFSIIIGTILLLDYIVLAPQKDKAVILSYKYDINSISYAVYDLNYQLSSEDREYEITAATNEGDYKNIPYNSFITVYKSRILNEKISFSEEGSSYKESMLNTSSIFIAFWVFIVLFYLPIINFVARGPNTVYLVLIHVNAYLPIFAFIGLVFGLL